MRRFQRQPSHVNRRQFIAATSAVAGGLIIVTAIYELPRIKSWRPYAGFCAGAIAFTFLILVMENLGR